MGFGAAIHQRLAFKMKIFLNEYSVEPEHLPSGEAHCFANLYKKYLINFENKLDFVIFSKS